MFIYDNACDYIQSFLFFVLFFENSYKCLHVIVVLNW